MAPVRPLVLAVTGKRRERRGSGAANGPERRCRGGLPGERSDTYTRWSLRPSRTPQLQAAAEPGLEPDGQVYFTVDLKNKKRGGGGGSGSLKRTELHQNS